MESKVVIKLLSFAVFKSSWRNDLADTAFFTEILIPFGENIVYYCNLYANGFHFL